MVFLVFSRQLEEILFREVFPEVLRRSLGSLGGALFFQHVNNNVQLVRGAWRDREGGERHQHKVLKFGTKPVGCGCGVGGMWNNGVQVSKWAKVAKVKRKNLKTFQPSNHSTNRVHLSTGVYLYRCTDGQFHACRWYDGVTNRSRYETQRYCTDIYYNK
jgi:hypothetical protein